MMTAVWAVVIVVFGLVILEVLSRLYYRSSYLLPFKPKIVGEYPFRSFIQEEDPPIFFTFKKDFRSPIVNINRLGLRGPDPAPDGSKKRLLVIGESNFFGVKLRRERDLWSIQLETMLSERGHGDWEVLNGGNPGYNTFQHRAFWERELHRVKPDILVLSMGINDVTQAWVMGSKWRPGTPWPMNFIYALERKSPWWYKPLGYSCLYFLLRRYLFGESRRSFAPQDEDFQWDACIEAVFSNYRSIAEDAMNMGAKVALSEVAFAYDFDLTDEDKKRISSIQSNWETFLTTLGRYEYQFIDNLVNSFAPALGTPHLDLAKPFRAHPRRFELYLDVGHVNGEGMTVYAQALYKEIDNLGWWDR